MWGPRLGLMGVGLAVVLHAFAWALARPLEEAPLAVRILRDAIPFLVDVELGMTLLGAGFVLLDVRAGKGLREALWEILEADAFGIVVGIASALLSRGR